MTTRGGRGLSGVIIGQYIAPASSGAYVTDQLCDNPAITLPGGPRGGQACRMFVPHIGAQAIRRPTPQNATSAPPATRPRI